MELFVDDAGHVRAPNPLVYRRLMDIGDWPTWWRDVQVRRLPCASTPDRDVWLLGLRAGWSSAVRMQASFHGWRPDIGVVMTVSGDVEGTAEFWLEPLEGGTIVHHLFVGETHLRPARRVHDTYRRAIRRGLWGLKDALQVEVRTMGGLRP